MKYINGIPFTLIVLTIVVYIPIRMGYLKYNKRDVDYIREVLIIAFLIYAETLLYLTLYPGNGRINEEVTINIIPFETIKLYLNFPGDFTLQVINLLGNVVVFIPIGFLIPLLFKNISFGKIFVIGLISTLFIETMQLILSINGIISRSFDVDDLILNTIGVIVGYILRIMFDMLYRFIRK
ncbi:VanZ family protein [Ornithinibacillus halotolerans]|uniref:Antibiotic resistance protein VanZ n=1 Tax=Ornithinibacillus halotolerans TaxID=1274357 RepID=A0A916RYR6_9BACI|nr:VanZ family protein [Ornithinibacillus halotolerans]GGA76919.1 antibiotic resistance protein VanZ [Ornithinibacillus halotolerans]